MIPRFRTLADAFKATFPPDYCRLVAVREHGDNAIALFDTRPSGHPYLYEVHYDRTDGEWSEGSSGNAGGWHRLDSDTEVGVVTRWGEAPTGAEAVRGDLEGRLLEEPVENGIYLLAWWGVPSGHPAVTHFRMAGRWVAA